MPADVLAIAERLWNGELSTASFHPVDHVGGFVEITDGVGFCPSFANVSAFTTDDGLVLVDTGSAPLARIVHDDIRGWSADRLDTAVYSHGHIDHVFGVPVWEEEAVAQGWPAPQVVAHHALPARFDRYIVTAGYNTVVNRRQFGFTDLVWPTEYRYPDRTYHETLELSVGGVDFRLRHEKGETDDHTVTWQPASRVLCCGDLFIWASPNAGNPQKVQRYPREWAAALRRMLMLDAEFLLPGHGFPVIGAGRVRQALTDTADLLDSLVDQTLEVMNAGGRLDDAVHSVRVPAALADRPYLQPVYDEPEFIVHTVWRLYGGWWDGNPATLKPAPERALAAELADLAGGAGALAARALELLELATADADPDPSGGADAAERALRLAGHLAEQAWLADPADPAVQRTRQQVFATRAARATSTMARGVFTWAANESVADPSGAPDPGHPQ
jgi:alkyl sulfatase BDS1-like metallo-beta-lactamase superfamily hydrolase